MKDRGVAEASMSALFRALFAREGVPPSIGREMIEGG